MRNTNLSILQDVEPATVLSFKNESDDEEK